MRDQADVAAELETLRLADVEARRQYNEAQRRMRDAADFCDTLTICMAQRRDRKFELFEEWCTLRDAHATAEALVDEDGEPAQTMPSGRMV